MLELLQSWVGEAETIARRVPALAATAGGWSWVVAAAAALAGLALLLGGVRLGPVLTGIGGAVIGWFAGVHVATMVEVQVIPAHTVGWAAAASLGVLSVFAPAVYPALLGAVPGALLGLRAPLGGAWLGAAMGAALLGGLALLLRRVVVAGTAAVAGAALLVAGAVALSVSVPALMGFVQRPVLLTGIGALLAVSGTAFQAATQGGAAPRTRSRAGNLRHE